MSKYLCNAASKHELEAKIQYVQLGFCKFKAHLVPVAYRRAQQPNNLFRPAIYQ